MNLAENKSDLDIEIENLIKEKAGLFKEQLEQIRQHGDPVQAIPLETGGNLFLGLLFDCLLWKKKKLKGK
jgi:hypothetical protein